MLEDDELAVEVIEMALSQINCHCQHFATLADICAALREQCFDLLLLDWSLPDGEADQVIRLVRRELNLRTPVLIVSVNDDEQQVVNALLQGADDYVTKPLRLSELQARVTVLLRNAQAEPANGTELSGYRFDTGKRVLYLDNEPLGLTILEYDLAYYFFSHLNELLSREHLLTAVWGQHPSLDTRTVDVFISRLRKKIKLETGSALQIRTLRGFGYRLELVGQQQPGKYQHFSEQLTETL